MASIRRKGSKSRKVDLLTKWLVWVSHKNKDSTPNCHRDRETSTYERNVQYPMFNVQFKIEYCLLNIALNKTGRLAPSRDFLKKP
jgi:hypothetical protein